MFYVYEVWVIENRLKFDGADPQKFVGLQCKASCDFYVLCVLKMRFLLILRNL